MATIVAHALLVIALVFSPFALAETRVYLLRGWFGVFSAGIDKMAEDLRAKGIKAEAIHGLYRQDPALRETINRYIRDFESMLRRILADRDGSLLGITILSSDMGKLYVALAQAIERLRT